MHYRYLVTSTWEIRPLATFIDRKTLSLRRSVSRPATRAPIRPITENINRNVSSRQILWATTPSRDLRDVVRLVSEKIASIGPLSRSKTDVSSVLELLDARIP